MGTGLESKSGRVATASQDLVPICVLIATYRPGLTITVSEKRRRHAMPPLVLMADDCRAAYDRMRERGVEFTQEPVDRYGTVNAGFRDPSGNGWKMIHARRGRE